MPQSQVPVQEEEHKTDWGGLSNERKKQTELRTRHAHPQGGGAFVLITARQVGDSLLAGLGLPGAGSFA